MCARGGGDEGISCYGRDVMAWLLKRKTVGINYTPFELDDDRSHGNQDYADFLDGRALEFPVSYIRSARQIKQTSGAIPDILTIRVFNFCNQRFKDFVESWESGLIFFNPVNFERKNGDSIGEYYVWTVGQDVDCILTDNLSEFWNENEREFRFRSVRNAAEYQYEYPDKGRGTVIRISQQAIMGRHLWTAGLLAADGRGYTSYFMSNEMYKAYKKEKFKGLHLCFPVEEIDRPWVAEENMRFLLEKWQKRERNIGKFWPDAKKRHGGKADGDRGF